MRSTHSATPASPTAPPAPRSPHQGFAERACGPLEWARSPRPISAPGLGRAETPVHRDRCDTLVLHDSVISGDYGAVSDCNISSVTPMMLHWASSDEHANPGTILRWPSVGRRYGLVTSSDVAIHLSRDGPWRYPRAFHEHGGAFACAERHAHCHATIAGEDRKRSRIRRTGDR